MTEELTHIRCHTCNKVIGHKWNQYQEMLSEGKSIKEALNKLGLTRPCCRMRMMNPAKVTLISQYQEDVPTQMLESSFKRLSVATSDEAPSEGALDAMKKVTDYTIVPEEKTDITLPGLPSLPALPQLNTPGNIKSKKESNFTRNYEAY